MYICTIVFGNSGRSWGKSDGDVGGIRIQYKIFVKITDSQKLFCSCFCIYKYTQKTIEGYLDSVQPLTFNTIKTELIMYAFHSSRYLQPK